MSEICTIIEIALLSAFFILLAGKTGVREKIVCKAPKLISELFSCDFCLSFWTSVVFALLFAVFLREPVILLYPLFSTPITRILI